MRLGAIEAGGTKFVAAIGDENGQIERSITIPTTTPVETVGKVIDFFKDNEPEAIGVGSFGPIDVTKASATYGFITTTPKKGWAQFNFVGALTDSFPVPIAWTTDVNAAGYGEYKLGNARGTSSCLYLTIGTGIGGGLINNNQIFDGFSHPEMGHILVRRHPEDNFAGLCPFHGDCLEGMASGPAVEARWGKKGIHLADRVEVWQLEAYYLAQALVSYTLTLRPERIILGGGLMKQKQIFSLIRQQFAELLESYVAVPDLEQYIQPVGLQHQAGIIGSLLLAKEACDGE